jgi:hypothetical protein
MQRPVAAPHRRPGMWMEGVEGSSGTRGELHGSEDARIPTESAQRSVLTSHLLHVSSISDQIRAPRSAFSPWPVRPDPIPRLSPAPSLVKRNSDEARPPQYVPHVRIYFHPLFSFKSYPCIGHENLNPLKNLNPPNCIQGFSISLVSFTDRELYIWNCCVFCTKRCFPWCYIFFRLLSSSQMIPCWVMRG